MSNENEQVVSNTPIQQAITDTKVQGVDESVGGDTSVGEPQNVQPSSPSFLEQIPEEYRNEPSLSNIKDIGSLAKGYVHAQKEIGSRIRVPGPDASPEVKAEFNKRMEAVGYKPALNLADPKQKEDMFKQLGRPDSPEGYDALIPEEVTSFVNQDQLSAYRQLAHKIGLSKEQAKELLQYDINRTMEQVESQVEGARTTLKEAWGDAFDQRLELSRDTLAQFEGKFPEAVAAIRNGPAGNNPVVLMMAAELGKAYKEAGIIVGNRTVSYGLTPNEARARIQEVMSNSGHPYHKDSDPKHWAAVEEVEKLYQAAYPEQRQSE